MKNISSKPGHRSTNLIAVEAIGSEHLVAEVMRFIEYHPPSRVSRNLCRMLLQYLTMDDATENLFFKDLIHDLDGVFELLEALQAEREKMQV